MRVLLVCLLSLSFPALACDHHRTEYNKFRKLHACPTGQTKGACPGYVVDHVIALCVGGPDKASNMQWQTKLEAKQKDKTECKITPIK